MDRAGLLRENIVLGAILCKGFGGDTGDNYLESYALNRTGGANPIKRIEFQEWVTQVFVDPFTSGPEVESVYWLWYDVQRATSVTYKT
ncbi:MAG: hypothetical protein GWN31_06060 [Candidatus Thorarchaeota archaeon]|nr:hypothetical protein [Candidatus Thorarchaeota archaeon]NIW13491.1 hypothetical protein [Candidatus Thorarchaeota archaeon]